MKSEKFKTEVVKFNHEPAPKLQNTAEQRRSILCLDEHVARARKLRKPTLSRRRRWITSLEQPISLRSTELRDFCPIFLLALALGSSARLLLHESRSSSRHRLKGKYEL